MRAAPALHPLLASLLAAWLAAAPAAAAPPASDPAVGFATITEDELRADLVALASAPLEGRDSPSLGLTRAGDYLIGRLQQAGFTGAGEGGSFRIPFSRKLPAPLPAQCALALQGEGEAARTFAYGEDFVPVWLANGTGAGEAVLFGFGIDSDADKYDDVTGEVAGTVAVIVEGEPRHKSRLQGPEVSPAAELYSKLVLLESEKAAGVLVVRRPPEPPPKKNGWTDPEPARLGFRHTWASWADGRPPDAPSAVAIPVLEITPAAAQAILGVDPLEIAAAADKTAKPPRPVRSGRRVSLSSASEVAEVSIDNIVGRLPGADQALAAEHVVLGAHYDHVGVDARSRIGFGADDNASGCAALLEVAGALGAQPPRRSILACFFAAEEDGLLGSAALCDQPPVPKDALIAMINMDMVGRGEADEVAILGVPENPGFEKLLKAANKLQPTKIRKLVTDEGRELFERSDHYSFHRIGIPVLFFFEGLPISRNADYHTWRDTIDLVDVDKCARTARLVYNTAWLLANDDERPPPPRAAK